MRRLAPIVYLALLIGALAEGLSWTATLQAGRAHAREGRRQEALALLEEARDRRPGAPSPRIALATMFLEAGRLEDTCRVAREVLRLDPEEPRGRVVLARALRRLDRRSEAARVLEGFADRSQARPGTLLLLARCRLEQGQSAQAERSLGEILGADPGHLEGRELRITMLHQMGRSFEALEELATYEGLLRVRMALDPRDASTFERLARVLMESGRARQGALELARRALTLAPGDPTVEATLGGIHYVLGQPARAHARFENCLDRYDGFEAGATPLYQGALAAARMGRIARARALLERALAAHPAHPLRDRASLLAGVPAIGPAGPPGGGPGTPAPAGVVAPLAR